MKKKDFSTLANLPPNLAMELRYKSLKSSLRTQGSFSLNLLRPTKYPESHRQYIHGDPVRLIDWKAYARSDRLLIREMRDEASAKMGLVVDISPSMHWPEPEMLQDLAQTQQSCSKIETAARLALNVAYIHLSQGDEVVIYFRDEEKRSKYHIFRPRVGSDCVSLLDRFKSVNFAAEKIQSEFQPDMLDAHKFDIAFYFSDGLNLEFPLQTPLTAKRNVFLQVLSAFEMEIEWVKPDYAYFENIDTQIKEFQGEAFLESQNYKRSLRRWLKKVKAEMYQSSFHYHLFTEDSPISEYQRFIAEY